MPTPSLILVPARFKTGKLYTPVATTSGALVLGASGDFNVTRATTATRVNASGLIESVASGIPRLDYPLGGGCPALLVEPSGTNLAFDSQTWATGTNWTLTNATTLTGTTGTIDPFGTNTANAISPTTAAGTHVVESNFPTLGSRISYTSGTIYTQSGFFKQGTGAAGRYVQITFGARFSQNGYANFDLQAGAVVASGGTADTNRAASIENYGNGWYRCRLTATCTQSGLDQGLIAVLITSSGSTRLPSFTGVTGDVLYGWGAQVETGSVATSYIPTTTAAVTRNADVISVTDAVSGCIGQTEGTIYAEFSLSHLVGDRTIFEIGAGNSHRIRLRINGSTISASAIVAGSSVGSISFSSQPTGVYKLAYSYAQNDFRAYLNGNPGTPVTSGNVPVNMRIIGLGTRVASLPAGDDLFNDRIRSAALYTTRLTNAELAALTTL